MVSIQKNSISDPKNHGNSHIVEDANLPQYDNNFFRFMQLLNFVVLFFVERDNYLFRNGEIMLTRKI